MTLFPKESGEFIVKHAKHITVHQKGIKKLSEEIYNGLKTKKIDINNFSQHDLHPKKGDPSAVDWIFVVDTLNFCFWTPGINNSVKYRVNGYTGYFALCAAINRALKENVDILNPKYYSKITIEELGHIMRSDDGETAVPLLKERVQSLHEIGDVLLQKYDGSFLNVVKNCKNNAQSLLKTIVSEFTCFRDEAVFHGKKVSLYKRAQILIGDLWACFHGKDLGYFEDIDTITMFADYRIPQVLIHFGCLELTEDLNEKLKNETIIANGEAQEVEIRGASIYIVEEVKDKVREIIAANPDSGLTKDSVNGILIDHFLWDYRREFAEELTHIPFLRVLGIYY